MTVHQTARLGPIRSSGLALIASTALALSAALEPLAAQPLPDVSASWGPAKLAPCFDQTSHGWRLPLKGDIRVLVIFARDTSPAGNANANCWDGNDIPPWADQLFDHETISPPQGLITDYLHQGSFGGLRVLGDYYPVLVEADSSSDSAVFAELPTPGFPLPMQHNPNNKLFDQWTAASPGKKKPHAPDTEADCLIIIWQNSTSYGCTSGINSSWGSPFGIFSGADTRISVNGGGTPWAMSGILLHELMHSFYGGNNYHCGQGAGNTRYTFHETANAYSLAAGGWSTGRAVSGWDRKNAGWVDPPKKPHGPISAVDATSSEFVATDLDIATHPDGGRYILRDSALTGDAVRVRLPHLDWLASGDVKNQYLWLENRRLDQSLTGYTTNFDMIGSVPGTLDEHACEEYSSPGLQAYLQVGKDRNSCGQLWSSQPWHPNGLASWLYPLPAEGRYDLDYRVDQTQPGDVTLCSNWGNANVPTDTHHPRTQPNPFSGHSDLTLMADTDGDGQFFNSGEPLVGLSEIRRDRFTENLYQAHGDGADAFPGHIPGRLFGMDTNPAPVPVYTLTRRPTNLDSNGKPRSYENRRVALNGISVDLIGQHADGSLEVELRWDDWTVNSDVRWCGDIVLANDPDDPYLRQSRIELQPGRMIDLDWGQTPTLPYAQDVSGDLVTSLPSILTLESGTELEIQDGARLVVRNGSTLHVKAGASLSVLGAGCVIVEDDAWLCIEPGADVSLQSSASRLVVAEGVSVGIHPGLEIIPAGCQAPCSLVTTGAGEVDCSGSCVTPPVGLVGWWPLDQDVVFGSEFNAADLVWDQPGSSNLTGWELLDGRVGKGLALAGDNSWMKVADAPQLDLGTGDLSMALWLRTNDKTGTRSIIDKLRDDSGWLTGYQLALVEGELVLQLGDGGGSFPGATSHPSGRDVADGLWHHLAVTVDRDGSGRFFIDGRMTGTFSPSDRQGSLANVSDLVFGASSDLGDQHLLGLFDEVMLFDRVLTDEEVRRMAHAGSRGVCRETVSTLWDQTFCANLSELDVPVTITNGSDVVHNYHVAVSGLPLGPGCTVAGPTSTDIHYPSGQTISVDPGETKPLMLKIDRPVDLLVYGDIACFEATVTNLDTGHVIKSRGSLMHTQQLCFTGFTEGDGVLSVQMGVAGLATFSLTNSGPSNAVVALSFMAGTPDMTLDDEAVSFAGLPPGSVLPPSVIQVPAGVTLEIPLPFSFVKLTPFSVYDIILTADLDFDGIMEGVATIPVMATAPAGGLDSGPTRSTR
jgi:hypothetical protein